MIRSLICLVAEGVIRDARTNQVSIFNLREGLTAEAIPLLIRNLNFFSLWDRTADDADQTPGTFTITSGEKEIFAQPFPLNFHGKLRSRQFITIQGILIPQPGALTFTQKLDSGETASYTITVNAVTSATEVEETPGTQS